MTASDIAPVVGLYVIGVLVLMRHPLRLVAYTTATLLAGAEAVGGLAYWVCIDLTLAASIGFALWNSRESTFIRYPLVALALTSTLVAAIINDRPGVASMLSGLLVLAYSVGPDSRRPTYSRQA